MSKPKTLIKDAYVWAISCHRTMKTGARALALMQWSPNHHQLKIYKPIWWLLYWYTENNILTTRGLYSKTVIIPIRYINNIVQ